MDPDPNSTLTINKSKKQEKRRSLYIATWNVRSSLLKRENEVLQLLLTENLDILFLTETDTKRINACNYKIKGYTTFMQSSEEDSDLDTIRIIALTKEECGVKIEIRNDLMSTSFPSIWLEIQDHSSSKSMIGGVYRQWSNNGISSTALQVEEIETYCEQINRASHPNGRMIITGDVNLDSEKWLADDYGKKRIAGPLLSCLEQNGLEVWPVGKTYQSDRVSADGTVARSALDHVYVSGTIKDVEVKKLTHSATDHVPVITSYKIHRNNTKYTHSITKRSFKNFTTRSWNESLAMQDWLEVNDAEDVDSMVSQFNKNVEQALDRVAPVKSFKIRSNHRFGLSENTKDLMRKRDQVRISVSKASTKEKPTLQKQYKALRNKVTNQIRKENIDFNNNRIENANNEGELWKIANEVMNPKGEVSWKIEKEPGEEINDDQEVAESFNDFFTEKIVQLKKNIDPSLVTNPLERLREKMKHNKNKLEFKKITQKQLCEHMKKLNKKKSSGLDGLSQENLILGAKHLIAPLTVIVNQSIEEGEFPNEWKEAAVTPVLKKGNPRLLNNYRPVSCLPAASKVLEIVVCSQLSEYLELNKLLPRNQHGFRPRRSTMTAWNEIQLDWAQKTEDGLVTGVLLWDLSAAFDTLDCDGLCDKLQLFGVQQNSVKWVRSFLTGRRQRVKIGSRVSRPRNVPTGVPQGGVLSPLIFVLFVSDLQDWLEHSTAPTYADDTTTGTSGFSLCQVLKNVEEDAYKVLQFMASNGLVANAKKTSFLLLNYKQCEPKISVKIGNELVTRESTATLLGIQFQDDQRWKTQIHGKGGVISSLHSRFYIIKRMRSHLSMRAVMKLVDGLFMSKVRYGLQLYGKVRRNEDSPCGEDFKSIQKIQNNLMRYLAGCQLKDKVSIRSLLDKLNMVSVNQLNAQIKLLEMWKSSNIEDYPLQLRQTEIREGVRSTRAATKGRPCDIGRTQLTQTTCISDAIKMWNTAPSAITESRSLYQAKREIKKYVKTLPV